MKAAGLRSIGGDRESSSQIATAAMQSEMRRERRTGAATAYAALGCIGLILAAAIVVYGVILLAHKT